MQSPSPKNILIVEDDELIAESLAMTLQLHGYHVCGISPTGEEAVRMAAQQHPQLVLMDVTLKGAMDGVEAGRQIHKGLRLPVVYITAYRGKAADLEKIGIIPLIKPYSLEQLMLVVGVEFYKNALEEKHPKRHFP